MEEKLKELFGKISCVSVDIDPQKTGKRMQKIRKDNENLIKYVCRHSRLFKFTMEPAKYKEEACQNNYDCQNCRIASCKEEEKTLGGKVSYINASQKSIGRCYGREVKQISEMESQGKSVTLMNILTYAYIAKVPLTEIIHLQEGFYFDKDGIIRRKGDPEYAPLDDSSK